MKNNDSLIEQSDLRLKQLEDEMYNDPDMSDIDQKDMERISKRLEEAGYKVEFVTQDGRVTHTIKHDKQKPSGLKQVLFGIVIFIAWLVIYCIIDATIETVRYFLSDNLIILIVALCIEAGAMYRITLYAMFLLKYRLERVVFTIIYGLYGLLSIVLSLSVNSIPINIICVYVFTVVAVIVGFKIYEGAK